MQYSSVKRKVKKPNFIYSRSLRHAAYRQFCWFVHARLGRGARRIIPSCVVNKIRADYPNYDGHYVGFKDGIESSEINFSWVGDVKIFVFTNFTCLFKKLYLNFSRQTI